MSIQRTLKAHRLPRVCLPFSLLFTLTAPTLPALAAPDSLPLQAAPAASETPSGTNQNAQPVANSLHVAVDLDGMNVDPQAVRQALSTELGLPLVPTAGEAGVQVRVSARAAGDVSVTYHDQRKQAVTRTVRAPERSDEVPELAALLAGNLARDYSASLIAQMGDPAPSTDGDATTRAAVIAPQPPQLKHRFFNLSFFGPLATCPQARSHRFNVELGTLHSHVGGVNGVGITGLVQRVDQEAEGFMVSGLAQLQHGVVRGASVAGALNLALGDELDGFQLAGAVNVASGPVTGAQIAGALNTAANSEGLQLAGAVNQTDGLEGAQISGAVNVSAQHLSGLQLSSVNITRRLTGAQIGLVNIGGDVEGLQLGIVNIAEKVNGASIGLVTYSQQGRTQLVTWFNATQPMNIGARFYTGPLYAMPTVGYDPDDSETVYPGFSLGTRIWANSIFVDLEGNYQNRLETGAGDAKAKFDEHDIQLRYRALLGYEVLPWLGVFAGGGVLHALNTKASVDQEVKPEFSLGLQFF